MKVSTEIDNNFGYEKIRQLVDNIPLSTDMENCHNCSVYRRNERVLLKLQAWGCFTLFLGYKLCFLKTLLWPQGLVTIQVNILSMYKHIQGRTSFFTPARFKSCLFFKFLLIYSKPCLVQLPRPYSFQKISWPPPRLPLVKAQQSFLSGIRPSREQHGPKVKVTAPPEVQNSRGFTIRYLVFSLVIVFLSIRYRGK